VALPGWYSLSSVVDIHATLEGIAVVFFVALVVSDVLAHLNKGRETVFERIALGCFGIAVLAEVCAYPYSRRIDTLSKEASIATERKIAELNKEAGDARQKAGESDERAGKAFERASEADERASINEKESARSRKLAEDEKLARVKLEETVAWRSLSNSQKSQGAPRLKNFSGEGVTCSYLGSDMEAFSLSSDIASMLRAAEWQVIPPSAFVLAMRETSLPTTKSPIEKLDTGVEVTSTADSRSTESAHAVVERLQELGFDAAFNPSAQRKDLRQIWVTVLHRPLGAQGEAKLGISRKKH
jgi:hypothetical protein